MREDLGVSGPSRSAGVAVGGAHEVGGEEGVRVGGPVPVVEGEVGVDLAEEELEAVAELAVPREEGGRGWLGGSRPA